MKRIFSLILVLMAVQMMSFATVESFKVTTTNVSGAGSITKVIESALQSTADTARIIFDFGTSGTKVIKLDETIDIPESKSGVLLIDGSSSLDTVIFDGTDKTFTGFYLKSGHVVAFKNVNFRNFGKALENYTSRLNIYDCEFTENKVGVYLGYYSNEIDGCVFGSNEKGLHIESNAAKITNCKFGLSKDEQKTMKNDIAVHLTSRGNITLFENNVLTCYNVGVKFEAETFISKPISSCFFGVNSKCQLVDPEDWYNQDTAIVYDAVNKDFSVDKCIFGCSKMAISFYQYNTSPGSTRIKITNSNFGVSPTFDDIRNNYDIIFYNTNKINDLTVSNCTFGYTEYETLSIGSCENLTITNNNFGGDGTHYFALSDYDDAYGVKICQYCHTQNPGYCSYLLVKDNVFTSNNGLKFGVVNKQYKSLFSGNLFYNIDKDAYSLPYEVPVPVITSVKESGDYIVVTGSIDTMAVATIELFYTEQTDQTATELVSSFSTEEDGSFEYRITKNKYQGRRSVGFTATATYDNKITSDLSKVTYLKEKEIDLTLLNYYVKENGTGDGSSWDKAMSPQSFAYTLPRVGDGVTFYVAEGTYYPEYDYNMNRANGKDATFTVNSDVTIKGGYPANAKTGSVSDPKNHPTVFSGDFMNDDEIVWYSQNSDTLVYFKNSEDDCFRLFTVKPSVKNLSFGYNGGPICVFDEEDVNNSFVLDGVTLTGSSMSMLGVGQNLTVTITNSNLEKIGNFYLLQNNPSLIIDHCNLKHCNMGQMIDAKQLQISNSYIEKCFGNLYVYTTDGNRSAVTIESVSISHNYSSFEIINSDVTVRNLLWKDSYQGRAFALRQDCSSRFENCQFLNNSFGYLIDHASNRDLKLSECEFSNNKCSSYMFSGTGLELNNCYFDSNTTSILSNQGYDEGSSTVVSNCTFLNNQCESHLFLNMVTPFYFQNNTVVKNKANYLFTVNNPKVLNNTIVGNSVAGSVLQSLIKDEELDASELIGNIILGNGTQLSEIGYDNLPVIKTAKNKIQYNIMPIIRIDYQDEEENDNTTWIPEDNTNAFVRPFDLGKNESIKCKACTSAYPDFEEAVLKEMFDGTYNNTTHVFTPVLDKSEALPVAKLKTTSLSEGFKLSFPLENTSVSNDQLDNKRLPMTAMGSVELPSPNDTVIVRDTIVLGETYAFNDKEITPEKIGLLRDTMIVKKGNIEEPQVLVLCVIPKKSSYYYVKKVAEGNGTGSSWNNAMSGDDFAFALPFAGNGTKFYFAEGVYNPIYDTNGDESDDPTSLCYSIKNNVTFYGGYPADAKIGATADPENHPTVFSGDHKGDDKVVKGVDENGRLKLTYSNRGDNSMNLFEAHKCDVTFNNVIVDGAEFYGINGNGDGIRFYGNNVTFQNCAYAVFYPNKNAVIFIDGSKFENISTGCLYTPSGWNTNVTSTVFSGNTGYIAYSSSEGMMSFDRVSVTGNNAHIYSVNTGEFKITNSEFINNDNSGSLIYMNNNGNPYSFLNTKFINNKTPQSIIENNGGVMTVDNCSFKGNESGSYMIRSGAGLIVKHSSVSENKTPFDIFNVNKLTLISDTIESNSSVYIARPCVYGASIDSCFIKNNDSYLFHSSWSATDNWRFDLLNSEIVGNIKSEETPGANITAVYVIGGGNSNDSVNIYRTKIEENSYENVDLIRVQSANLDLDQSVISKNSTLRLLFCESSIVLVHNSSFFDNNVSQDVIETTHCWNGKHDHFINNTIASNSSKGDLFDNYYDNSSYVNNTIIGNKIDESLFKYPYDSLFVGNIVFGNTYSGFCYYDFRSDPSNNLIPLFYDIDPNTSSPLVIPNSTNIISDYYVDKYLANPSFSEVEGLKDIKDRSSEIASLFEGTYDPTTGLFTPVLKDNGGFTPTVALKSDKLSDGTSIRFPRLDNVLTDQRGELRDDMTCMGAYETTGTDTVTVRDTIVLGNTYVFNDKEITPTKVGLFRDTMLVKKDNKEVVHVLNLYVKPYALFNCYVKIDAEGTGDGSSWENAMSAEDFAFVLPFAAVGADFYVAEGTYKPIYDELGYETDDSTSLCYRIKNNVSIYGGYPANAKTGATPDPENHPTIFTGDIKGDDKVVKGKDEDGRLELTYVNHDENATQLFLCDGKMTMVSLHDVIVDGASYGIIFTKKEPHLDTDNTTFRNCYRAVYCPEGGAVVFTEDTKFENNSDYCLYTPNGWNTHISTTSFTGNTGYLVYTNSNMMSMDSVSVRGNNAQIYSTDISEFKISNSEFVDNESTGNLFYMNNIDNTAMFLNVEFINNKIVQDVIGNYGSNGSRVMTVDNSIFKSNETGSYLINSTDGLIVRHSFVSDNQIASDMFFTYKLTLLSDTFELNKSKYIAYPCLSGASIDSCLIKNNDSYLFYSTKSSTDNWRFDLINSDIVDNYKTNLEKDYYVIYTESNMDSVNIARTKFIGNKYEEASFIHNAHSYFDFDECIVDSNYIFQFLCSALSQTNIFNSTFVGNNCNSLMLCQHSGGKFSIGNGVTLKNNTIVNNINKEYLYDGYYSKSTIVNNTIVGNTNEMYLFGKLYQSENTLVIGNILFGNINGRQQAYSGDDRVIAIDIFDNNIMALDTSIVDGTVLSETNIISDFSFDEKVKKYTKQDFSKFKNHIDDVASLFEGTYDATTGLFTPVIKNNGGFTPTVALKSDKLSDGTSIRFPRLENVLTDQRGVERFDSTCMGAYEMRCNAVDTVLKDTVMVGDSYTFIDKNLDDVCQKVGSYHFTETLKSAEGCDSIVKLSLAVRPQKNENGYYVKEDGTGDGSDWNNAMSPKDFAEYLPLVYDGETFHIAAGTYKSTYVDPDLGRMYNINSSVTLIGGYPDTVTSVATPSMPDVYVTKLTADVKDNDYTYYYPNSLDYTPYSNVKDNDSILIRVNGEKTLNLYGMTLSGVKSCDKGAVDLAEGSSLVMDRCFVQDNVASGVYGKGVDVKVTNSVFTHNYSNNGAAFNLTDSKLNVQSTAVYENRAKVEECESEYAMGGVANLDNTEATFENSTLSNNAADMGSVFSVKSSKLDLVNNTIVGNQIIPESKHKGSVIGSLDDKSSVSLFGNIVIGNQNGEFDGVVNVASSDYNVFSYKTDMTYGSHDMVMNDPKEVQMLLDGDLAYGSETVFIPNVQYNGGYTPTVAVIQSAFDGGKILNIPLDDRKVSYDQRGFVRKDSSCIGAYEFPTFTGYYVKKQAHGDGSGRDWENSMNDTTFAKYFPIVPTNASFHVAEGVYSPMFDSYGKLTDSKSRRYSSSRPVNIYGGYPDSAQTGCVADPVKYKTVLSVDYNGDDKYVESESDYIMWMLLIRLIMATV